VILVDKALAAREAEGRPIRVGMIGAGFMGRGVANQIINSVPGMVLAAVSNRHAEKAVDAYGQAGVTDVAVAGDARDVERHVDAGRPVVTEDAGALCAAGNLDCLLDVTGAVEFGAQVTLDAFDHGKHVVTMNA
jgi:predicted homoserine dehydrogenase-like protein